MNVLVHHHPIMTSKLCWLWAPVFGECASSDVEENWKDNLDKQKETRCAKESQFHAECYFE
jgi:hypothetical protein